MISRHGAPLVLECEYASRGNHINALARKSDDGKTLILTVINLNGNPVSARLRLDGFDLAEVHTVTAETLSASSLADLNTAEIPDKIVPVIERRTLEVQSQTSEWTFTGFSFTLLHITR
jgi:alpha-L-arabinofuranosidase